MYKPELAETEQNLHFEEIEGAGIFEISTSEATACEMAAMYQPFLHEMPSSDMISELGGDNNISVREERCKGSEGRSSSIFETINVPNVTKQSQES